VVNAGTCRCGIRTLIIDVISIHNRLGFLCCSICAGASTVQSNEFKGQLSKDGARAMGPELGKSKTFELTTSAPLSKLSPHG
jgi:hypothetical protein